VSLVPSLSEALVVMGLGDRLVGVTEYCVHPAGAFAALPRLGGTKDADVVAIAAVRPDLVIANQEENTARVVRKLAEQGIDVWVTYPRTVREGVELLCNLATLGATAEARERFVAPALLALESAEQARAAATAPGPKVFCPIWRDPWMTIGPDTYIHDMIELCGGQNLLAAPLATRAGSSEQPQAAGELRDGAVADRRYPIVDLDEVIAAGPDVILLPDEPYAFDAWDAKRLGRVDCPAARSGRVHLIDGTLVSWYGPRIAEAIQALAAIFADS
jgi:ABC-type hemin transport system substrate-binding protein